MNLFAGADGAAENRQELGYLFVLRHTLVVISSLEWNNLSDWCFIWNAVLWKYKDKAKQSVLIKKTNKKK